MSSPKLVLSSYLRTKKTPVLRSTAAHALNELDAG